MSHEQIRLYTQKPINWREIQYFYLITEIMSIKMCARRWYYIHNVGFVFILQTGNLVFYMIDGSLPTHCLQRRFLYTKLFSILFKIRNNSLPYWRVSSDHRPINESVYNHKKTRLSWKRSRPANVLLLIRRDNVTVCWQ